MSAGLGLLGNAALLGRECETLNGTGDGDSTGLDCIELRGRGTENFAKCFPSGESK